MNLLQLGIISTVLFIIYYTNHANFYHNSILFNKIILFFIFFVFSILLSFFDQTLFNKLKNKKKKNDISFWKKSIFLGIFAILGYSLYLDLILMPRTQNIMFSMMRNKILSKMVLILFITLPVFTLENVISAF